MLIRFSAKGILTKTRMENEYHLKTNLEHLIKKTDRWTDRRADRQTDRADPRFRGQGCWWAGVALRCISGWAESGSDVHVTPPHPREEKPCD